MILQLATVHRSRLATLVGRMTEVEELSVCVQSALSTLVALAGGLGELDCIDEGRVKAIAAGDIELADLLRDALEELESELTRLNEPEEPEQQEELVAA